MNVGRNDPCPCGSGQKYKKCCAAKDEAATTARLAAEAEAAAKAAAADPKDAEAPPAKSRKEANARVGDWHPSPKHEPQDVKSMRARRRTV